MAQRYNFDSYFRTFTKKTFKIVVYQKKIPTFDK